MAIKSSRFAGADKHDAGNVIAASRQILHPLFLNQWCAKAHSIIPGNETPYGAFGDGNKKPPALQGLTDRMLETLLPLRAKYCINLFRTIDIAPDHFFGILTGEFSFNPFL